MATLTKGKTFTNGETVTPQKLHELIDLGTVTGIVNADISATAAIADIKLAQITTANKVAQSAVTNLTTDLAGKAPATGIAPSAIAGTAVVTTDSRLSDARTPTSHTHGNLTNAGAIGSTANLPVVTTTSGVLTTIPAGSAGQVLISNGGTSAPSFQTLAATSTNASNLTGGSAGTVPYQSATGTTAMLAAGTSGQVLRSNGTAAPSWLTLTASATTDTTNAGNITSGTLAIARIPTGTTSSTVCIGNDSRLSDARTPTAHTHGNITTAGAIGTTSGVPVITGASGVLQAGAFGTTAGTFCQGNDSRLSDARTPVTHTHAISDTTGLQVALDSKIAGSSLGLCKAWVNFNHTRMLGVTNAANGESISVTTGSSSGTWTSTTAFSTGQLGIIYYITSAGAVPNALLGGINVSTLGFQIRAISGNTATIKLIAGPATASQTITGNGGTSGFQYISYGIRAQYGVSSITKAASGSHMNFTFNFSTPFDFIDYCYQFQMDARSTGDFYIQTKGQSSIQIQVLNFSDASVSSQMNFMAFGL